MVSAWLSDEMVDMLQSYPGDEELQLMVKCV